VKAGVATATADVDAKSRKNVRRIGSSAPFFSIGKDTCGDDPDSPYVKRGNSRLTHALIFAIHANSDGPQLRATGKYILEVIV
jgi:hypothetical protein